MKRPVLMSLVCVFLACSLPAAAMDAAAAAAALAARVLGDRSGEITFQSIPRDNGQDVFAVEASGGKARVSGSSAVAMASGLNCYLKQCCHADISWGGDQLALPNPLPDSPRIRHVSPFTHRYCFNYCTFSYSMAFWDWPRWEREIDWMALNGITMPLAVTGQEAIWQKVFTDMGLSQKELDDFFVGPAYLPFGWMGCIDGWGGPLPQRWIDAHRELQQQIVARQRELGMTPVLQGFTGHVPKAIVKHYPQAKLQQLPSWCGFPGTYFLDPADPLFVEVGKAFIEEQTRQYGTDHFYASDTFIEMNPPSSDPAFLADMGAAIHQAMRAADPDAVWVMQGWIFYFNPDFWKPPQTKALLGSVPDDHMLLLDLFCDTHPVWNKTEAFYGKPWAWCVIHNFGAVPGIFGDLRDIARGLPAALADPARGRLSGMGMMMEGIENNPVYYQFLMEMAWRTEAPDVDAWIRAYPRQRYGQYHPDAEAAWQLLLETAYASGAPASMICARPALDNPSAYGGGAPAYDPARLLEAAEKLLACAPQFKDISTYQYDLVNVVRQVLSNLAAPLCQECICAYENKTPDAFKEAASAYLQLILDMDALLGARAEFLLGRWIAEARRWAANDDEARLYEWNARNQITLWGPRDSVLHGYARKHWNGLLADFYHARWRQFFEQLALSLEESVPFDSMQWNARITAWEEQWTHEQTPYPSAPQGDPVAIARELLHKYAARIREDARAQCISLTTGKPVSCSSALPGHPPENANDGQYGDTRQYWAVDTSDDPDPWWQVDLETPQRVGRMTLVAYYGDARRYGFIVESSLDGQTWDIVADRRERPLLATRKGYTCVFTPRLVRFLRVRQTSNSANTGRHWVEVMAFTE